MPNKTPSIQSSILIATFFVSLLWVISLLELLFGLELYRWGVYPRSADGILGIVFAPLIHGSWQHLFSNSAPLLLLGGMVIFGYPRSRWWSITGIWLLSGIGVWLFARSSFHYGASGLSHGLFFYLLISGLLRRDKRSAALLMVAFFMYSGMLLSIFPTEPGISFEYHFFGAVAGTLCAYGFRHLDPKPMRPGESDPLSEEDDRVIGDQWKIAEDEQP